MEEMLQMMDAMRYASKNLAILVQLEHLIHVQKLVEMDLKLQKKTVMTETLTSLTDVMACVSLNTDFHV